MPREVSHNVNRKMAQVLRFQRDDFSQVSHFGSLADCDDLDFSRFGEIRAARLPAPAYLIMRCCAERVSPWTRAKEACAAKQKDKKPHAHKPSMGHPENQHRTQTENQNQ
jgi:hypothetical protein